MLNDGSKTESATATESARPWAGIVDRVRAMEYGETIPTSALYAAAGIDETPRRLPGESDKKFQKRCERGRLTFASVFDRARRELLRVHRRDVRSSRPGEYTLVRPSEQADTAQKDALAEARRALSSGARRAEHVERSALNDEQRKRASDVEAHLDSLRGLMKPRKK